MYMKTFKLLTLCLFCIMAFSNIINAEDNIKVAVMYDERFLLHDTGPNHPERPDRLSVVINELKKNKSLSPFLVWPIFKKAKIKELGLVHTENYINLVENEVKRIEGDNRAYLSTGDTVITKNSHDVARLAVGAGIKGVNEIMNGSISSAFAVVRPPGHHAFASKGSGFCIYNNIAIVARYLQKEYGLERILIVDFDVHHGNGTQDIFYEDNSVFYFSVHQHPLYPQSGRPSEIGSGKGKGFTLNVELPKGSGDVDLLNAFNNKLRPAMDKFKPEFILVSAGFDGQEGDLLGQLNYTPNGYNHVALILKNIAEKYASGRTLYIMEGGYVADNISKSVNEIVSVLVEGD